MHSQPASPELLHRLRRIGRGCAIGTVFCACVALFGWIADIPILTTVLPDYPSAKMLTAIAFVALGVSVLRDQSPNRQDKILAAIGAAIAIACGIIGLGEVTFHSSSNFPEGSFIKTLVRPMAPATAVNLGLFGSAVLALISGRRNLAQGVSLIPGIVALLAGIALLYDVNSYVHARLFRTMGFLTEIATILLTAAICFQTADVGVMNLFTRGAGGAAMRRLFPWIVGLPIVIGWFRMEGERKGYYGAESGVALFAIATIVAFTTLSWRVAKNINRSEAAREKTVAALEESEAKLRKEHAALLQAREQLAHHATDLELRVQERTRELEQTVDSLHRLVYSIAHDLRAPLRAMQAFTQILKEDYSEKLEDAGRDCCQRVHTSAVRMDELLSDLLDLGRISQPQALKKVVDLNAELEQVLAILDEPLQAKNARVEVAAPLPVVCGDSALVEQVLINLVDNALKFSREGVRPEIRIFATRHDDHIRLFIADNGIGIAREHWDKIFGVFQRLHRNDQYPGTGIGLAIVHKAVERMGGNIGLESTLGSGTSFWIDLPAEAKCAA